MVKFTSLVWLDGRLQERPIREIPQASIQHCAHFILVPEHYREDHSCRCDDPSHDDMSKWGYKWNHTARRWE